MIELKDLKNIKAAVYLGFGAVKFKIEEIRKELRENDLSNDDEEDDEPMIMWELNYYCREFYLMWEALEAIKSITRKYAAAMVALRKYAAGEEWNEYPECEYEDVYAYLLPSFEPNGDFYLCEVPKSLARFFKNCGDINKVGRMAFDKFFPQIKKGVLVENDLGETEIIEMSPEMEFQHNLEEDLRGIEIYDALPEYIERMTKVREMLKEKVDPIEILKFLQ